MSDRYKADVAIVGGGPAGIGVARGLAMRGVVNILIIERNPALGGVPLLYRNKAGAIKTFLGPSQLRMLSGETLAGILAASLQGTPVAVWLETKALALHPSHRIVEVVSPDRGPVAVEARAIVLACGARERTLDELGWISGSRLGRIFHTPGLLELLGHNSSTPLRRPLVIGSHLNAHAVAAKLVAAGAEQCIMIDAARRPACPLYGRLYFRMRVGKLRFIGGVMSARLAGSGAVSRVDLDSGTTLGCDGIVVSSELVPNSDLARLAGMAVTLPDRRPVMNQPFHLSAAGWFAVGNIQGGFHGAHACFQRGIEVAAHIARYLQRNP